MRDDIQTLLEQGEGEHAEFRAALPSNAKVAECLTAFLNHKGGRLVIGATGGDKIRGVPNAENAAKSLRTELGSLITPQALWTVETVEMDGKTLLVLEVGEGADKPYVAGGAIYLRRGFRTVHATRDEIGDLIEHRTDSSARWERQLVPGAEFRDLDLDLVRETAQMAVDANRWSGEPRDSAAFLYSLGLAEGAGVTNAALALFGMQPTRYLPQMRVRVLVSAGGKTSDRYDSESIFDDCLIKIADQIPTLLEARVGGVQSDFSTETWQRTDNIAYPLLALREGVMNALVHRDYDQRGMSLVLITPESIRIANPGSLPGDLKPGDLKRDHPSVPRNPDIAYVCYLRGLIENVGRGTQRILEDCKRARLRQPKWESSRLQTSLTFFARESRELTIADLNHRQAEILTILRNLGPLSARRIVEEIKEDVTDRTIRTDLRQLVQAELIEQRGRGPSTTYVAPTQA